MARKRGNGEGTIRQMPSGRWSWARMAGRDVEGKVVYDRVTANTKKELIAAVEDYKRRQVDEAIKLPMPDFTLWSEQWYDRYKSNLRISTQGSYEYTLRKLQTYWGNMPLDQIKTSSIDDMLIALETEKVSKSYIKKMKIMLSQILGAAEADDIIRKNPARYSTHRIGEQGNAHSKDAFTAEEICNIWILKVSKQRDFAILSCATGMRTQELLALRGDDIAEDGASITISRAVNMDGNIPIIGLTKSRDSNRVIPVPTSAQHIAAKYRNYGECLIWQSPQKPDRPINPSTYRAAFERLCKAAGVRCLTPHCCRHTYITQLHAHGVDMTVIKALAGHSRRDVTEGYTHLSWETLSAAADKLNDLFDSKDLSA